MPQAAVEEGKEPKRPVRRRASAKSETARPRAPRTRSRSAAARSEEVSEAPVRKAPTTARVARPIPRFARGQLILMRALVLIGIAGSAAIGFTDKGTIDVASTIEARNDRIRNGQPSVDDVSAAQNVVTVPVQEQQNLPNGGLRGRGIGSPSAAAVNPPQTNQGTSSEVEATSTATTTESSESSLGSNDIEPAGITTADASETPETETSMNDTDTQSDQVVETDEASL